MGSCDRTSLVDRMKRYEAPSTSRVAYKGLPVVARLDGQSFRSFTQGLRQPFDVRFCELMGETMLALIERFGAVVGYTQSDEITLIWYIPSDNKSEYPFDGRLHQFDSVLASFATVFFNKNLAKYLPEKKDELPLFDCQTFVVPNLMEAYNELLWRQQDAAKSAISMAARSMFTPSQLQHKSVLEMREMMFGKRGINFDDYPSFFKRGLFARRVNATRPPDAEPSNKIRGRSRSERECPALDDSSVEVVDIWLSKQVDPVRVVFYGDPVAAVAEKASILEEPCDFDGVFE